MTGRAASRSALVALGLLVAFAATPALADTKRVPLPVPRVVIYPGDKIDDDLIMDRDFPQAFIPRFAAVQDRADLAGKVAKRTLLPGYPIPLNAVREPDAVTAGVPVQLVFQSGALTITAQASPLKSAQAGEVVSVRNVESGRTVSGVVQQDGTVLVGSM